MNDYKKELDTIHMSDDLKQKIRNIPYEETQENLPRRFSFAKFLIPLSLVVFLFLGFALYSSINKQPANTPSENEEMIVADDGKTIYTPIKSGMIGGMGGHNPTNKKSAKTSSITIPKQLPIYKIRYSKTMQPSNKKDEIQEELIEWLNLYARKLSIDKKIDDSFYQNQNVSLMIGPDAHLYITLFNTDSVYATEDTKTMEKQLKEKVSDLIPFKDSIWDCDKTYCSVYEKAKTDKATFINQKINQIKITPHFLLSQDSQPVRANLEIIIDNFNNYQKIDSAPIINEDSARSILKRGGYYYMEGVRGEVLPKAIEESQILSTELIYGSPANNQIPNPYMLPIYRYRVKLKEGDIRNLDVIAVPQKELKKHKQTTWYFENKQ